MKITPDTINILRNFAGINSSLWIEGGGHEFETRTPERTVLARATVPEFFENSIGIYDLNSLLQYFKMAEEPEIEIEENYLVVRGKNGTEVKYTLAEKELLVTVDKKFVINEKPLSKIAFDSSVLETILTARNIGAGNTKADTVQYELADGKCCAKVFNSQMSTSNVVTKYLDHETDEGSSFSFSFKSDQFPMLMGNYELELYRRETPQSPGGFIFFARYFSSTLEYITPAKANAVNFYSQKG